jgi:hypothetical protein
MAATASSNRRLMMGLFDRRKRDKPQSEVTETEPAELDEEAPPLDAAATLYRTMHLQVVPAGDDVLLNDPERAAPMVLPAFELDLLAQCTYFAPVEEHAAAAAQRTGLPADGVAQRLYELVDRGLLVSKQEVLARARDAAAADPGSAPVLDRVAVVTTNRPASLATCLRSYRERYGADIELVVFDDSADAEVQKENRRVLAQAGAGGRTMYAGEAEKGRFVRELSARSGIEIEVVRAAVVDFDGHPLHCGSNRNAVLLDASGGAVLMVDDDTTARATWPPDKGDGLRVSSRYDPWSLRFFKSLEDALHAAEWQDEDLLAWHRRFLGRSPAACAFDARLPGATGAPEGNPAALDLDEADSGLVAAFSRGRGRVLVTSAGVAGDSGMASSLYFLWLDGAARQQLLENYELYRSTRAVHRSADVTTISNTAFFMTPHAAFDVRDTIPPFPPVLRNADGAFGSILRTCAPESYVAFLPWSVEHSPPETRPPDFDQVLRFVGSVRANDILRDLVHAYEPSPGVNDAEVRLRALGQYLIALGTMPATDFDAFLRQQIAATVGRRIDRLTRVVERESGQPVAWAQDCVAVATAGLRALTEDELVVADISGTTADERHRRFQRLLYRFGRLIDAWPALLEAAKGQRVGEPLRTVN